MNHDSHLLRNHEPNMSRRQYSGANLMSVPLVETAGVFPLEYATRLLGKEQPMELNEIGDPTYIALATFKKSGEAVNTPVWVTREGEKLYVWTQGNSWKVKRIRNNPHVRVAVSDGRGNPQSDWVDARAVVQATPELEATQRSRMVRKYGLLFRAFALMASVRRTRDDYVVLEISDQPATSIEDPLDQV